jgi:hypothetical protein
MEIHMEKLWNTHVETKEIHMEKYGDTHVETKEIHMAKIWRFTWSP